MVRTADPGAGSIDLDIHDDITDETTALADDDRFALSDESETDDPTQYAQFSTIVDAILKGGQSIVPITAANVAQYGNAITISPTVAVTAYGNGQLLTCSAQRRATQVMSHLPCPHLPHDQLRKSNGAHFASGELPDDRYVLAVFSTDTNRFVAVNYPAPRD